MLTVFHYFFKKTLVLIKEYFCYLVLPYVLFCSFDSCIMYRPFKAALFASFFCWGFKQFFIRTQLIFEKRETFESY